MSFSINKLQDSNRSPETTKAPTPRAVEFSEILQKTAQFSKSDRIKTAVENASQKYNLPPTLIYAVIKQESGFNPLAESHCGAQGLMQLMPGTARQMGVTDSYNPEQNIDGGSRYLREMLDRFDGDPKLALAAYNAGPGRVEECGGIPKIAETQNYVVSVLAHYEKFNGSPEINLPVQNRFDSDLFDLQGQAAVANAIASTIPLMVKRPELSKDEPPPPPPPPQGIRV